VDALASPVIRDGQPGGKDVDHGRSTENKRQEREAAQEMEVLVS
jgi:hypothetical protein